MVAGVDDGDVVVGAGVLIIQAAVVDPECLCFSSADCRVHILDPTPPPPN